MKTAYLYAETLVSFLDGIRHRIAVLLRGEDYARDLDREMQFHLELDALQHGETGAPPLAAESAARRRFGNVAYHREETRRRSPLRWIDAVRLDLRYALRGLRRSPGLTTTIVLTFALGVGVNAAMFTVIDRVYFQAPSGVADPGAVHRLVAIRNSPYVADWATEDFSIPDYAAFQAATASAAEVEGYEPSTDNAVGDAKVPHTVAYATTGFFHLARTRPFLGRFPIASENSYGSPTNVAVLGYDYWQRGFAGDSAVLGRRLLIDSTTFVVIGVAMPRFHGFDVDAVDVWAPLAARPMGYEGPWWLGDFSFLHLFSRVAPGHRAAEVQSRLHAAFHASAGTEPRSRLELAPLVQGRGPVSFGPRIDRGLQITVRLAGVALVVALLATANVASLLLMRALRRRREIAVRIALGVSGRRLVAQFIAEAVVLAIAGGFVALVIAANVGAVLRATLLSDIHWPVSVIDSRTVILAATLAIVTGAAAALAPVATITWKNLHNALKTGSSQAGRSKSSVGALLLVTQIALCILLLAVAGSFLQTLRRAMIVDRGYDPDRLITFQWFRAPKGVVELVAEQIRALPEVESVSRSGVSNPDASGGIAGIRFANGDTLPPARRPFLTLVDTAFASTYGVRLVGGRLPNGSDLASADSGLMINETMASRFWVAGHAVGSCFTVQIGRPPLTCRRVVGVVRDLRLDLSRPPTASYYVLADPGGYCGCYSFAVRTRRPATLAVVAQIRRLLADKSFEPGYQPNPLLMNTRLDRLVRPWRVAATMFVLFGLLALVAAAAGIYGLVAYDVAQRTHEIGVRITLGATTSMVMRLVLASGSRIVVVGLVAGVGMALGAGRLIASLLFETSPYDPRTMAGTACVLAIVALIASLVPAWRAARTDPVVALRAD